MRRIRLTVAALLLAGSYTLGNGLGQECGESTVLRREAQSALEGGQLDRAADLFERAVRCTPGWAEGWWRLGTVEFDRGRHAEARSAFEELSRIWPGYGPAHLFLGLTLLRMGGSDAEALTTIRRGQGLGFGEDPTLTLLAGRAEAGLLCSLGRFEEAYAALRPLVNKLPEDHRLHELLGLAALRIPDLPERLPRDRRSLAQRIGRAFALAQIQREEDGIREFAAILEEHPETPNGRYAYGVLLLAYKPEAAVRQFQLQLEEDPMHLPALLQLSHELLQQERREEARGYLERALDLEPRSPAALGLRGRLHLEEGDATRAIQDLEAAAELVPENPTLYILLSRAYAMGGRPDDVRRVKEIHRQLVERESPRP